jgi:hypothetical protein
MGTGGMGSVLAARADNATGNEYIAHATPSIISPAKSGIRDAEWRRIHTNSAENRLGCVKSSGPAWLFLTCGEKKPVFSGIFAGRA